MKATISLQAISKFASEAQRKAREGISLLVRSPRSRFFRYLSSSFPCLLALLMLPRITPSEAGRFLKAARSLEGMATMPIDKAAQWQVALESTRLSKIAVCVCVCATAKLESPTMLML